MGRMMERMAAAELGGENRPWEVLQPLQNFPDASAGLGRGPGDGGQDGEGGGSLLHDSRTEAIDGGAGSR